MTELAMVLDVESLGLHGEGFAAGWCVVDLDEGPVFQKAVHVCERIICDPDSVRGTREALVWVHDNVPGFADSGFPTHCAPSPFELRRTFWVAWSFWKKRGATLWADCGWPVEANFLRDCVLDGRGERDFEGPFPLHEIATFKIHASNKVRSRARDHEDLPEHDPLLDARDSAKSLLLAWHEIREARDLATKALP